MSNLSAFRYCAVIGCRKEAAVALVDTKDDEDCDCLCLPCYWDLALRRPDLKSAYRWLGSAQTEEDRRLAIHS